MKFSREFLEKVEKMDPVDRPMIHKGHRLKTRRDFLSQGFISSLGFTLAPSLLSMLRTDIVMAVEGCEAAPVSSNAPVLIIDLAGGNMQAGNHMIVGTDSQDNLLSSYAGLGLPPAIDPAQNPNMINRDFNVAMHANSAYLEGMLEATQSTVDNRDPNMRNRIDGGFFAAQSENDRSTNPLNPVYWMAKAGANGTLTTASGTRGSQSGGRSVPPAASFDPTLSPVQISRVDDLTGLINLGVVQNEFGSRGIAKVQKILKRMEGMSQAKINSFTNKSLSEQLKSVAACGFDTTRYTSQTANPAAIDPTQDAVIQRIYQGNQDNRNNTSYDPGASSAEACIVKALCDGLVGVGTLELGGYDYHGDTRLNQDNKDYKVGKTIGRALSVAAEKNKDLMIIIITDGGVATSTTMQAGRNGVMKYRYSGDNSSRSGAMMFVHKAGVSNSSEFIRDTSGRQIGEFVATTGQVDRTTGSLIQSTAQTVNGNLAAVLAANYMALHGEEGKFLSIVGDTYQAIQNDLDRYLLLKKAA